MNFETGTWSRRSRFRVSRYGYDDEEIPDVERSKRSDCTKRIQYTTGNSRNLTFVVNRGWCRLLRFQIRENRLHRRTKLLSCSWPVWIVTYYILRILNQLDYLIRNRCRLCACVLLIACRTWELTGPWTGAKIKVPTKFIVGDQDLVYHFPGAKEYIHGDSFKEDVPHLEEVVVIEGAAHFINQEKADEINSLIYDFITKF